MLRKVTALRLGTKETDRCGVSDFPSNWDDIRDDTETMPVLSGCDDFEGNGSLVSKRIINNRT